MSTATATAPTPTPIVGTTGVGGANAAAVFKRLHPASYLSRFLSSGYRPDGRPILSSSSSQPTASASAADDIWRQVSINTGSISTAHGSALVRMGDTTMVCGVKAEIGEPDTETPGEGFVVPNIDLPALSSPRFKPGPPGDEAQTYSNWLNELLVSSKTIPLSSLLIAPGKAAWVLYIDVVCINYDGNAFDAAVLAVMAALRNTRLPKAVYDDDTQRAICSRTERYPLKLGRMPLSCSFGIFERCHAPPPRPNVVRNPIVTHHPHHRFGPRWTSGARSARRSWWFEKGGREKWERGGGRSVGVE
ncbi:exosome complex component RRP43 [Cryptococcus gattii E566]|uniref:Ribosomal RNA-processing protein 43 n=2 Tax=Cryptococcus gattii TaxID=37769 RepID=E6QYU7_CRYGW|nr:Ribosomal RNA-processing protein 43, putative [Cryptococcus gattii WM276]ADV19981.1 Ribosomal RNA-processing protein 43, putative [Cryptococcus gattii WM276]KIR79482.1 exosome complex component RRP43 [Cryptococcus gattii EJB2]KIY37427.1 exosome complex component RRP43 [Cryptococcus gattii E566]KJE00067.1 exosome complex component RRP43 [Cryptococcus gattii NT-10]